MDSKDRDLEKEKEDRVDSESSSGDLSLRGTVGRFARRLNRDLGVIEKERQAATLEREERHRILKRLLVSIESDLQEATLIELGFRYKLTLSRIMSSASSLLRLSLLDRAKEREEVLAFEVLAEDREQACVFQFGELGETLESFPVTREESVRRLDFRLRRSLRNFFDRVQSYISDPKRIPEDALLKDRESVEVDSDVFDRETNKVSFTTDAPPSGNTSNAAEEVVEPIALDIDFE